MRGLGAISLWTSELKFGFKRNYNLFPRISLQKAVLIAVIFTNCLGLPLVKADQSEKIGVVILHGFGASPNQHIAGLTDTLTKNDYLVERPEMCWSLKRAYDQSYLECLKAIDAAITKLKDRGATRVVVAGFSMGGVAALAYGASHEGLDGVIAIAPAHFPDYFSKRTETAASIAKAQAMVKSGHGDDKAAFAEFTTGWTKLNVPAGIYLSFNGPDSPGFGQANAAKLKTPLLWVAGTSDPSQKDGPDFAFAKAPPNAFNRYVKVAADHLGTPDASREAVLAWLKDLQKSP